MVKHAMLQDLLTVLGQIELHKETSCMVNVPRKTHAYQGLNHGIQESLMKKKKL